MTIWISEQIDPCGIVYSCIAYCNEQLAQECHDTWENNLTETQKQEGWTTNLRVVDSWGDVPVNALKIN
jgi:hypothetical protein